MENKMFIPQLEDEKNIQLFRELENIPDIELSISNNFCSMPFDFNFEDQLKLNSLNEDKTIENKKEKIKQINKESAKRYRQKRKALFEKLTNENKKLKKENLLLKKMLKEQICPLCKSELKNKKRIFITQNPTNSKSKGKKISSITLSLAIIFLFFYCINKINSNSNYFADVYKGTRVLKEKDNFDVTFKEIEETKINYQGWYIYLGDYYSISNYFDYFGNQKYSFNNKGKVKLHDENNIYEKYLKKNQTCSNCITDISNKIKPNKTNPLYFNIYISNQSFTNDSLNLKLDKTFSYIEITCKIIGLSQNFIE